MATELTELPWKGFWTVHLRPGDTESEKVTKCESEMCQPSASSSTALLLLIDVLCLVSKPPTGRFGFRLLYMELTLQKCPEVKPAICHKSGTSYTSHLQFPAKTLPVTFSSKDPLNIWKYFHTWTPHQYLIIEQNRIVTFCDFILFYINNNLDVMQEWRHSHLFWPSSSGIFFLLQLHSLHPLIITLLSVCTSLRSISYAYRPGQMWMLSFPDRHVLIYCSH